MPDPNVVPINCTVVFMNDCMSYNKCKKYCSKIGSGSFRWFHDTCCECISPECIIDIGINWSRCSYCPPWKEPPPPLPQIESDTDEMFNIIEKENVVFEVEDDVAYTYIQTYKRSIRKNYYQTIYI